MGHKKTTPLSERLWALIMPEPNSGCWLWMGWLHKDDYGCLRYHGRRILAHRASWMAYRGPIPSDKCVLHKCDVPQCVNPDHLFLGTHIDNMEDMKNKNRHFSRLSISQVREIKTELSL